MESFHQTLWTYASCDLIYITKIYFGIIQLARGIKWKKKELLGPIIKESEHTDVASRPYILIKEVEGDNTENKLAHHHRGEATLPLVP